MNSAITTEESEDTDCTMARHESELEAEGRYGTRIYRGCRKPEERRSYHDVVSSECCCEQLQRCELQEIERRPRRRTKSQVRRHVLCNHPQEPWNLMERVNCPQNVDATLNKYQHLLNQETKKSQDLCSHNPHLRKRQMSVHRRLRKEQDQISARKFIDFDPNPRVCCEYERSMKDIHGRDSEIDEQSDDNFKNREVMRRILEDLDYDFSKHLLKNYMQQKERMLRPEACMLRQHAEKVNKLEAKKFSDDDNRDLSQSKLRFALPDYENSKEIDLKNIEEENQTRKKPNAIPNKPFTMKSNLKSSGLPILPKNKIDDMFGQKNLVDRLQEEDARKETEDRSVNKRKPSIVRQNCKPIEEVSRKETREETPYDLIMKDEEEEENSIRKNIYGGGDLELRATKSHILSLIDRAISSEFGKLSDQQQSPDSSRGITGQEICIEIMRQLHSNCCQSLAEDLLSHQEPSADCIKLLKMLRSDHMTHIQEEFRKLCNLQKFLDTYSPRQSSPAFQYPAAGEQRTEERQQQHEEKQNSGTIP
ncbi:uncharacterized protein LOC100882885 isoform X2 [Megachile rotundata]|uniref:uncharacterized protein LOC100882885 isoform X2 n=1 Tax=Megachile rotundata TaxID=143995 RepID=UPI000614AEB4|nr:PREDICTED: uncharacterized protein LOC100882885 isoform X2 [Megachile rotundata]